MLAAGADVAAALVRQSSDQALIAHLKLQIEKFNRNRFGPRSERTARLLDQMELQLEELETSATEDELAAERAAANTTHVASFARTRPTRRPFPEHLPRHRVVAPAPTNCLYCGSDRLRLLGEDTTKTLEVIPVSGSPRRYEERSRDRHHGHWHLSRPDRHRHGQQHPA